MTTRTIAHGVTLHRHPAPGQAHPDGLGQPYFWEWIVHQLYAQMPWPGLFNRLHLNIWDERNTTLQDLALAQNEPTLLDYDVTQPGSQRAVGLHWPGRHRIDLLMSLPSWDIHKARDVLSHEFGHYYQHQCGLSLYNPETTPARRVLRQAWDNMRPKQGHNSGEDWAEVYRAVAGCQHTRTKYSDGTHANIPAPLRSLMRGAYWFSFVTGTIADFSVGDFYLQWRQELPWFQSEWRYFNTDNWTLWAWRSGQWQQI